MPSNYPGGLDDFAEASPGLMSQPDTTGRRHTQRHDDVESAVEAVQRVLGVNPQGGAATVAARIAVVEKPTGAVNLLNRVQSSSEGAVCFPQGIIGGTQALTSTYVREGTQSTAVTSTATPCRAYVTDTGTNAVPVKAGNPYTVTGSVRVPAGSPANVVRVYWFTASGAASATQYTNVVFTPTADAWTDFIGTVVAPSDAAYAQLVVWMSNQTVGWVNYFDRLGFWEGAGGVWVPGGDRLDPSTLGGYWDESVGRRYFRWDTNNQRYQMVYGDTGWRDISSLLINGWTGSLFIRRSGNVVDIRLEPVSAAGATADTVAAIPAGFRATSGVVARGFVSDTVSPAPNMRRMSLTVGTLAINRTTSTATLYGTLIHTTADAWPTTLPGTPVGAIPQGAGGPDPGTPEWEHAVHDDIDPEIPTGLTDADDVSGWTVTYPEGPKP